MNKKLFIYLTFIGLIGFLFSCKKDETKVVMLANPNAPTIQTIPDLTLKRTSGTDTLVFVGTTIDPGFQASATYFLEAALNGTNFADPIAIASDIQDKTIKITVSDLNGILLKKLPADQASSVDFRIRAVLTVDSGTGALGTSTNPLEYLSEVKTVNVTVYGLPKLDLIGSGLTQKIESALGDGNYTGFVKLDLTKPFTLLDPDTNTSYGANGSALAVNGAAIAASTDFGSGWYQLTVNKNDLTFTLAPYMVGLIGDATPNGWNSPDQKMDYDSQGGFWHITLDLIVGSVKIRYNDTWGAINLGLSDATHPGYTLDNLWNNSSSQNIPIASAGNYTVKVFIGSTKYSCTITKNN